MTPNPADHTGMADKMQTWTNIQQVECSASSCVDAPACLHSLRLCKEAKGESASGNQEEASLAIHVNREPAIMLLFRAVAGLQLFAVC
eukprot:1148568-Pelagomonas_calceolata.AAC.2